MSRIKTDAKASKRAMLNTTINEEVLGDFKAYCKELGFPMNILIEAFMREFSEGSLILKIGRNNRIEVDSTEEDRKKDQ